MRATYGRLVFVSLCIIRRAPALKRLQRVVSEAGAAENALRGAAGASLDASESGDSLGHKDQLPQPDAILVAYNMSSSSSPDGPPRERCANATAANRRPKDRCLILTHIPKAGGTSLFDFFVANGLKLWARYGSMAWDEDPRGFISDRPVGTQTPFHDADVYMGHFTPQFKAYLQHHGMKRNCYEATMLRNPLERVASSLFFHNQHGVPNEALFIEMLRNATGPGWGLGRFPKYMEGGININGQHQYYNTQAKILGAQEFASPIYDKHFFGSWDQVDLNKAIQQVSAGYDHVGFAENYEHSLDVFMNMFGLQGKPQVIRKNRSKNPGFKDLSPELQHLIRQWTVEDQKLYVHAVRQWWDESLCAE